MTDTQVMIVDSTYEPIPIQKDEPSAGMHWMPYFGDLKVESWRQVIPGIATHDGLRWVEATMSDSVSSASANEPKGKARKPVLVDMPRLPRRFPEWAKTPVQDHVREKLSKESWEDEKGKGVDASFKEAEKAAKKAGFVLDIDTVYDPIPIRASTVLLNETFIDTVPYNTSLYAAEPAVWTEIAAAGGVWGRSGDDYLAVTGAPYALDCAGYMAGTSVVDVQVETHANLGGVLGIICVSVRRTAGGDAGLGYSHLLRNNSYDYMRVNDPGLGIVTLATLTYTGNPATAHIDQRISSQGSTIYARTYNNSNAVTREATVTDTTITTSESGYVGMYGQNKVSTLVYPLTYNCSVTDLSSGIVNRPVMVNVMG